MNQLKLTRTTSVTEFDAYYRLKSELVDLCRQNNLPAGGSKTELADRIRYFLATGALPAPPAAKRATVAAMPAEFNRQTLIGSGWRCSQSLRLFFEAEIGPHFHFDGFMRDFIKNGAGKTLQEAIDGWTAHHRSPAGPVPIAPQFEYNCFIRAYFEANKGKMFADAVAAWNEHKTQARI
jgi:hypothetical protein